MAGTSGEIYVAYLFVHCFAILSCSVLFVKYCVAMLPTRGSAENERERERETVRKIKQAEKRSIQFTRLSQL